MTDTNPELMIAAVTATFLEVCADALLDNAERFTCSEAEAIAELMTLLGYDGEGFIEAHSIDDDEGDDHYQDRSTFVMANGRELR